MIIEAGATKTTYNKLARLRAILGQLVEEKGGKCAFCKKAFTDKEVRDGLITSHHSEGTKFDKKGKPYRVNENLELVHPACHKAHHILEIREKMEVNKKLIKELMAKGLTKDQAYAKVWKQLKNQGHVGKATKWGG